MEKSVISLVEIDQPVETGDYDGDILYNSFFVKVKNNYFEPLIMKNTSVDSTIQKLFDQYRLKYTNTVKKINIICKTERPTPSLTNTLKSLLEYLLLDANNPMKELVEEFINKNPTNIKFTMLQAVSYLLNGIIYIDKQLLHKLEFKGQYNNLEDYLKESNISTVTPILLKDRILMYYPGSNELIIISELKD